MTKSFNSYLEFFNDLKGVDLSKHAALLFFFHATNNAMGCNCKGKIEAAIDRYKGLVSAVTSDDKAWLKERYKTDVLSLKQDNETFVIDL